MDKTQLILLIVCSVLIGLSITWGILLQFRILTTLIPGYNRHAKNKDAIFFEKIYAKYVGLLIIITSILFGAVFAGLIFHIVWLIITAGAIGTVFAVFGIFYINSKSKPRKSKLLAIALDEDPNFLTDNDIDLSEFNL
ncbi:MAG: hypothetical protein K5765_04120, partial [Clostridia bacterium]|nr:hypothetical protein [Clostridia bacterium]